MAEALTKMGSKAAPPLELGRIRQPMVAFLALVIAASALWNMHVIDRDMPSSKADLVQIWVGVRTTLAGGDPYSEQVTREIQQIYYGHPIPYSDPSPSHRFIYPVYTAFVLAPLALLTWNEARLLYLLVMPLVTVISVPLWLRVLNIHTNRRRVSLLAFLTIVSWPVMWSLRECQPTLIVAMLVVTGSFLFVRGQDTAAGLILALATIKPQLVGPLMAWLLLWAILQRRWLFILSFCGGVFGLLAGAEWRVPGWIQHWRGAVTSMYFHDTYTRPLFVTLFGARAGAALMTVIAIAGVIALWRLRKCPADSPEFSIAVSLALALSVSLTPGNVAMIYNQSLLLPGILILVHAPQSSEAANLGRNCALMWLGWGYLAIPLAVLGTMLGPASIPWYKLPFCNPLLPLFVTLAIALQAPSIVRNMNFSSAHSA